MELNGFRNCLSVAFTGAMGYFEKRLVRPGLGFGSLNTARRTLAGYEAMAMIRRGQVQRIGGRDMRAQAKFIEGLFQTAA